ncbi:MAG: hypothetical protein GQ534_08520, partial [Candidatus Delongbacteria bacterium]|nr:hypothetical protein [Candidatus Delongbacteria bacterium]
MKEQFKKAAEFISQNTTADDYSFFIYDTDTQDARYAQNMITQNMTGTKLNIRLSVAFGNKTGSATVNSFEESSLIDMIKTAETIAKMNKPDPEYVESASKAEYPKVNNVADGTEKCTIEDIVEMIQKVIDNAKSKNVFVSGLMTRTISDFYTSTKNGFEGFDRSSSFSNSMTMSDNINKEVKVERS